MRQWVSGWVCGRKGAVACTGTPWGGGGHRTGRWSIEGASRPAGVDLTLQKGPPIVCRLSPGHPWSTQQALMPSSFLCLPGAGVPYTCPRGTGACLPNHRRRAQWGRRGVGGGRRVEEEAREKDGDDNANEEEELRACPPRGACRSCPPPLWAPEGCRAGQGGPVSPHGAAQRPPATRVLMAFAWGGGWGLRSVGLAQGSHTTVTHGTCAYPPSREGPEACTAHGPGLSPPGPPHTAQRTI